MWIGRLAGLYFPGASNPKPFESQSNLTRLFVNDIEVFVPPNTTVLEACEKVGVQVREHYKWIYAQRRLDPMDGLMDLST